MTNEKTPAEIARERILTAPVHESYKPVDDLPIPLYKGLLMKEAPKAIIKTVSGIIIGEGAKAENVEEYKEGILYAIGPMCSEYMRLGLKYQFSFFVDTFFWHKGIKYYKMDETMVHYVMTDHTTVTDNGHKSVKKIIRTKKLEEQTSRNQRLANRDDNEKDARLDKTKGKIRKVK